MSAYNPFAASHAAASATAPSLTSDPTAFGSYGDTARRLARDAAMTPDQRAQRAQQRADYSAGFDAMNRGQVKRDMYGNPLPDASTPPPATPQTQPYQAPAPGEAGTYQPPAQPNTALSSAIVSAAPAAAAPTTTPASAYFQQVNKAQQAAQLWGAGSQMYGDWMVYGGGADPASYVPSPGNSWDFSKRYASPFKAPQGYTPYGQ